MISLENITLHFGSRKILEEATFRVSGNDRIALVGPNGAGKTTLLKMLSGFISPDSGKVVKSKHFTVGYLPQETVRLKGRSLYDEVYSSADNIKRIQEEMSEVESELKGFYDKESDEYFDLFTLYSDLQDRYRILEGHKLKSNIEKILIGLGFSSEDFEKQLETFSGGWHMRVELAKLLLKNPSVLLLDEPTNNLDFESLLWLENYLRTYNGAVVLVSHDRTFLDNLSKRTYEIGSGNLTVYQGNYSYYIRERKSRMELLENRYNNQQKYIEQQEKFINRFRYKATKARAVQSRIKLLDKIDRVEIEKDAASVNFRFPPAVHSGKILLEIEGLYKSYNRADFVLSNISLIVERGDKIAIVGKNGSGKTTLTRIIAGMESISSGSVKFGYNVKIKYYAQNQAEEMNPEKTALEIMEQAEGRDSAVNLRSILGGFLFHGDDAYKKTGILSGGEKSRLALAKMLIEPSNFLILDEPTNHLDIASKDILTSALSDYEGCVMVVSHDRDFIDSFVTKIIEVRDGGIKVYGGNSYEYQKKKEKELADLDVTDKTNDPEEEKVIKNNYSSGIELKKKKKEFTRASASIKKEISQYEEKIKLLESRKKEIEEYMSSDKFYLDVKNAIAFTNEYREILSKIEKYSVLWEEKVQKFVTFKKNSIN